jgi:ectoine hydroxylase-related dioxygenase (phytanoyl-CoA dioxygenase family)
MLTLPHHVEFLSDRWLEEARSFLERETLVRKERLGGKPFSVSERFIDAPPHLKLQDNVGAWTLRYDGAAVSASRGFDETADVVVEGDYQAALSLAQFVGVLAPGGSDAMWRECRHLHGEDAVRAKGAIAGEEASTLLGLLHDHLARRTVENPDLAHRARRLGLTGKIREMEDQGYAVVERAISPELADETRAAIKRAVLPQQGLTMGWMLYQAREIERVTLNPMVMTLIDASLGRMAQLATMAAIIRGPGAGLIDAHTDYVDIPEPYPEFAMSGVSVWAFEDWTESAGPTWIVPGSHRLRRAPRPKEAIEGGIPMEMPKGSVVFFTQGVWHWQGARSDPGERVTLHPHFNRCFMRSIEPKKPDVQLLERNPPRLGEMLGEQDWFDRMTTTGRDYARLEHMRDLQAFNNKKKREILEETRAPEAHAA